MGCVFDIQKMVSCMKQMLNQWHLDGLGLSMDLVYIIWTVWDDWDGKKVKICDLGFGHIIRSTSTTGAPNECSQSVMDA